MKEKGTTPSGLSEAGYRQALENFVYHSNNIAKQIQRLPGNPIEKVADLMARGETFQMFEPQITALDAAFVIIAEEYGYTEAEVEQHLQEHFGAHLGDFMLETLVEEIQQDENPN